jgi:hypothetical protein
MGDATLWRMLGAAAVAGGALRIVSAFVPWAAGVAWLEAFYLAIDVLLLFGLMGVYFAHRERLGVAGFVAFALAETGIASIVGPDSVAFGIDAYQIGVAVIAIGLSLFAAVLLVRRAGPVVAPILWIASTVAGLGGSGIGQPEFGFLAGGILFGLGFVAAGWDLLAREK